MPSVRYSGPTNSTFFTTCCGSAIVDSQQKCPSCNAYVYPFREGMTDKERAEASGGYYHHNTRMARSNAASGRR